MANKNKIYEEDASIFSKIFCVWIGKYINENNKRGYVEDPLVIPSYYSLERIERKYYSYWKKHNYSKINFFICNYYSMSKSYIKYIMLLLISMLIGYGTPLYFDKLSDSLYKNDSFFYILTGIAFFCILQIIVVISKTQATHYKWKLVTAVEYNTKNYLMKSILNMTSNIEQGEILNVFSVHCARIKGITGFIDLIINSIGIILGIISLSIFLGVGGLISGLLFIILIVLISKSSFIQDKYDSENYSINEKRLALVSFIIERIKEIKLLNFDNYFKNRIEIIRNKQSKVLYKRSKIQLLFIVIESSLIPFFTALTLILTGVVFKFHLSTTDILITFIILDILEGMVNQIFIAVDSIRTTLKSVEVILNMLDLDKKTQTTDLDISKSSIHISNCMYSVKSNTILKDINLDISKPELITINGEMGSGKSSLLKIIAGEITPTLGIVQVSGKIATISSDGWFVRASLKDNIVLGKEFDREKYNRAIELSCLNTDICQLSEKDNTIIIDNADNLSGGQKIRLQLARAIYQDAQIIVVDDVLAAIDKDNRNKILKELIIDYWRDSIRIIVNSSKILIDNADRNMSIKNGILVEAAKKDCLVEKKKQDINKKIVLKSMQGDEDFTDKKKTEKLEINRKKVLLRYLQLISGKKTWVFFLLTFFVGQAMDVSMRFYSTKIRDNENHIYTFVILYCVLFIIAAFVNAIRCSIVYCGNVRAGNKYHARIIDDILNVDYELLDNQLIAREKTIAANDMRILDENIANYFMNVFEAMVLIISTCVMMTISNMASLLLVIPFLIVFYKSQEASKKISTYVIKRANVSKEETVGNLCNTLKGKYTIKHYNLHDYAYMNWDNKIKNSYYYEYTRQSVNRYELQKINLSAISLLFCFSIFSLTLHVNTNFILIIFTYILAIVSRCENILRNIRHAEIGLESLSRIEQLNQYEYIKKDMSSSNEYIDSENAIDLRNVSCTYGDGKQVLRNYSMVVKKKNHVLLKGKSGIGKSTIFNCIEKLIKYDGNIYVNGKNVQCVDATELHDNIFILTQKPLCFEGTLRENIDPYCKYSDDEIQACMTKIGFTSYKLNDKLDKCSDGEMQMICLCRALLTKAEIILVDEGFDNIDEQTQKRLCYVFNNLLSNSTVLCISHIGNEMNYDEIISLK